MKKIIVALLLTVGVFAGGNLPEVEPVTYVQEEVIQPSPFYVGIGYAFDEEIEYDFDYTYSNISIFAGAVLAREGQLALAVEGRAAWSVDDYGVDSIGIYAKPEFEVDRAFNVFGILGYQKLSTYDYTYDAFGIGLGGVYLFTDNIGVQVDWIYSMIEKDYDGFQPEYGNTTISILYNF